MYRSTLVHHYYLLTVLHELCYIFRKLLNLTPAYEYNKTLHLRYTHFEGGLTKE